MTIRNQCPYSYSSSPSSASSDSTFDDDPSFSDLDELNNWELSSSSGDIYSYSTSFDEDESVDEEEGTDDDDDEWEDVVEDEEDMSDYELIYQWTKHNICHVCFSLLHNNENQSTPLKKDIKEEKNKDDSNHE